MKTGWWKGVAWLTVFGTLVALASVPPAALTAQQTDRDCRCVDANGDDLDDCTCFRLPRFEGLLPPIANVRPRLGISVRSSQGADLDALGAEVTRVMEDGPADEAGIREDDVITSVDGQSLFDPLPGDAEEDFDLDESIPVQRLLAIARDLEPGQEVEVEYLRDGERRVTTVEAADLSRSRFTTVLPELDQGFSDRLRRYTDGIRDWSYRFEPPEAPDVRVFGGGDRAFVVGFGGLRGHGLELVEVRPGLGEYFGVSQGVLVADIDDDSPLGLEPGDVIVAVGDREVTTPQRLRRILDSYGDDEEITFRVQRDGRAVDVLGRLGQ